MFATGEEKNVYNMQYRPVNTIPPFPKPPVSSDYQTRVIYQYKMMQWRRSLWDFQKRVTLPVPIGFTMMRPRMPELIPPEVLADSSKMKRLLTRYNAASSPLGPGNQLYLERVLASGERFSGQAAFPEMGLDGKAVALGSHMAQQRTWESELIPVRPEPHLYATFTEYEEAMMRWALVVLRSNVPILPDALSVGQFAGLGRNAEHSTAFPPPPPPPDEIEEITKMWSGKVTDKLIQAPLQALMKAYVKASEEPGANLKIRFHARSYVPSHARDVSASRVVRQLQEFGVPFWPETTQPMSLMRRKERAIFDVGLMASPEMTNVSIPMDMNQMWLRRLVMEDPLKLLLIDFTPYDFHVLIRCAIPGRVGKTNLIGGYIIEKVSIARVLALSYFSEDARFIIRLSILMNHVLENPVWYDDLLELDMETLDRFIELVVCPGQMSYPVPTLPDSEIDAAVNAQPDRANDVKTLAMVFKQAQLFVALRAVVFSSGEMCYPFFGFMRNLVTNLCAKIASILGSNNMMDMIIKGFLATSNRSRQMFYFRVIRTAILLDSRMIIRILAQQPWLSIIWRGLTSKHRFTIFASKSLWQLMSHTSAEVVLKAQFIKIGPKAFCELFLQATPMATAFFERVIKSFRNVGNTCSYVAIPLSQYQQYLDCFLHIAPKDNRQMSIMRFRILELLKDNDCITASTDEEIYAVVNKFAESWVPTVVSNTNLYDIGSLKVLFLFRFLNQTIVANPTLWRSILGYMNSPQGSISLKQRKEAWQTFENAILNQEMFGTFLSESSDIFQTVVSAFVSPPPGLHPFPVNSALKFARALNEQGPSGAVSIKNLDILFRALANPDANFGKILLMVFNGIGAGYGCRIQVNQFVAELLKAGGDSPLREFFSRRHMEGPIGTIIKSVKSTQSSVQ